MAAWAARAPLNALLVVGELGEEDKEELEDAVDERRTAFGA